MKKKETVWVTGAITPRCIASSLTKFQTQTHIGAHDIFLGQVRADQRDGKTVKAIAYEAYQEMAETKFMEIEAQGIEKFDLSHVQILHSLGKVNVGEICLFVCVSAPHRKAVFEAIEFLVNAIKKEVPIFGKEIFDDQSHTWKVNT